MPPFFSGPYTAGIGNGSRPPTGRRPGVAGLRSPWPPLVPGRVPPRTTAPPPVRPPPSMPTFPPIPPPPSLPAAPSYPSPPSYPPPMPIDPYGPTVTVDDRRTPAPAPAVGYADDGGAYADDWAGATMVDGPAEGAIVTAPATIGATALDLWDHLFQSHLGVRNVAASASGEAYPETTVGDVRRAALRFSHALCLPRYDGANLCATRAAWRDACARVDALTAGQPWAAPYPESERFWLSDALALAQRLAEVDRRRNRGAEGIDLVAFLGDRSDALTTWQDLRAYFLSRRLVRRDDRGDRYPEATVGDVEQIVRVFEVDLARVIAGLTGHMRRTIADHAMAWRDVVAAGTARAAGLRPTATYPYNAAFWQATRKLAIWLSTGADLVRDRQPPTVR